MATAPIVTRSEKASGIIARHEAAPLFHRPGAYVVRDTLTGSGRDHIATVDACDCRDHQHRGNVCKHMRVARQAAGLQLCPSCGEILVCVDYWVGGRGWTACMVCPTAGSEHYARRSTWATDAAK